MQSRDSAKAYFARLEMSLKLSTTWLPEAPPPLTPKDRTPPKPRGRYLFASWCDAWFSRPGYDT